MSIGGTQSMCGQRPRSGAEETMNPVERSPRQEAGQDNQDSLKSAALAAATAELGLSELPEAAFFRSSSALPSAPSQQCATVPGTEKDVNPKHRVETNVTHKGRVPPIQGNRKKLRDSAKPGIGSSQLTQSQLDANWDAL